MQAKKNFFRLLNILCAALVLLIPCSALATGDGNMDGGGGGMGSGSGASWWDPGEDGVRVTVVDAGTGEVRAAPQDFSNISVGSVLHFGKVSKISYRSGTPLTLRSGSDYHYRTPATRMPTIVSSGGSSNIEAIKRYWCSEYAVKMVADAVGIPYAGKRRYIGRACRISQKEGGKPMLWVKLLIFLLLTTGLFALLGVRLSDFRPRRRTTKRPLTDTIREAQGLKGRGVWREGGEGGLPLW